MMNRNDMIQAVRKNPVFYLATMDGNQPRVRGMLLYSAGDDGIIFHTAKQRDLFAQIMKNNMVELCFNADGAQIRISGKLELVEDDLLKDKIASDPSRAFLAPWRNSVSAGEFHAQFAVFKMTKGHVTVWTMERNLEPKIEFEY
ncbi:MAG: pyridoxamine 5'-phosphate oxidase family protein [Treponema sp.]|nr:pyridoxamine 5'-phosphate oxidase family protein [Treponema sp.]